MENKLIAMLYEDFSDIREKIVGMATDDKKFYLHTLKGALASLGIQKLANDIKIIEDKIYEPEVDTLIEVLLNKLDVIDLSYRQLRNEKYQKYVSFCIVYENWEKFGKYEDYHEYNYDISTLYPKTVSHSCCHDRDQQISRKLKCRQAR